MHNAQERKEKLTKRFKDWYDPICRLIQSTPANEILMERGVAHKHSLLPVLNLSDVMSYQSYLKQSECQSKDDYIFSKGPGPILLFVGDSYYTTDPVLAQGFTIGMEAAADLVGTLEMCLRDKENDQRPIREKLSFLRSTEMVQAMAQPRTNSLASFLSSNIVRPAMRMVPSFLKEAAFSCVMKYSLGYYGNYTIARSKKITKPQSTDKTNSQ